MQMHLDKPEGNRNEIYYQDGRAKMYRNSNFMYIVFFQMRYLGPFSLEKSSDTVPQNMWVRIHLPLVKQFLRTKYVTKKEMNECMVEI